LTDGPNRAADEKKRRRRERHAKERDTKRRRAVAALKALRAAVRWLPMPVACALGHALGSVAFVFAKRVRCQTISHLAQAMPELAPSARRRIARRSFALLGRGMFAFLVAHRMGTERALGLVRTEGVEHVRAAIAPGKGVLLVTCHFGCFEMLASFMGHHLGGRAVGRATDDVGPTALLIEMRRELGCDTIQRGEPLEIVRTLRAGKPVAMLIDQDTDDVHGGFVPFFGRLAHTPLGPAALAVRTKTPIVMAFVAWDGLSRHVAFAFPPLHPRADLPEDRAVLELTARMTKIGEDEIRRRPDHWVWMHRRWQTRPEDHPDYPVWTGDA
jgi:KDO2-lipid IV(A) lauroyltransferase